MKNVINIEKERKRREQKRKKELILEVRQKFRNSIWAGLVDKYGVIPPEQRDIVDKLVRQAEVDSFGEPPK